MAIFAAGLATPALADDHSEELKLFSAEDVFELEWADDPQVSPDGSQAIYVRRFNDIMTPMTIVLM